MADVFISYAREDRARAELVARSLSAVGLESFWDTDIPPGQTWADYIEGKLTQCKAVVVLWSEHSAKSQWVREEARMGRDRLKLIPARLDGSPVPFGFGEVQAANLSNWRGEANHPEWQRLSSAVCNAVGMSSAAPSIAPSPASPNLSVPPPPQHATVQPAPQYAPQSAPDAARLSPIGYVQKCLRMYVNGAGRARRAEYGWWLVFLFLASSLGYFIDVSVSGVNEVNQPNAQIISSIVGLGLAAPGVSVLSRRLHDLGLSGWLVIGIFGGYLAAYLLVAEGVAALGGAVFLMTAAVVIGIVFIPGNAGPNQYGPDPKGL